MERRPPPNGEVERGYRHASTARLNEEQTRWRGLLADLDDDIDSGAKQWTYPESTRAYILWHLETIKEELAWRRANDVLRRGR